MLYLIYYLYLLNTCTNQRNPIQSHRIQPKVARATPKREQAGEEAAAGAAGKEAGKEAAKEAGKEAGSLQRVHSTIH